MHTFAASAHASGPDKRIRETAPPEAVMGATMVSNTVEFLGVVGRLVALRFHPFEGLFCELFSPLCVLVGHVAFEQVVGGEVAGEGRDEVGEFEGDDFFGDLCCGF